MRVGNGSQPFRRDPEGTLESEPFLFQQRETEISDHHHDHPPPEELSVHRIQVLARRCAFPLSRRIPRVTKRRTGQLLFTICLFWVIAAYIEWRAQHSLRRRRKQLVAFLQETTFYVVEEGRLSEDWQSPLQRRLASDLDFPTSGGAMDWTWRLRGSASHRQIHGPAVGHKCQETGRNFGSAGFGGEGKEAESDSVAREPQDVLRRQRDLEARDVSRGHESCPLIYTVDAQTAKKHGLLLFQEELELLGTVTARLCRCLCFAPMAHAQERPLQDPSSRRTASTPTSKGGQENAEDGRPRRRLGVCEGEAHAIMLEEMLKGANVVISGDAGWFYKWFESMRDAYARTCSHFSTRSTLGIPEGTILRTVLTGTDMYEDSWFQLEGAAWRPFRHPFDAVRHGFNFMQYKLRQNQVGPLGKSMHTDLQPMMVAFDGCVSINDGQSTKDDSRNHGRLLIVPDDV